MELYQPIKTRLPAYAPVVLARIRTHHALPHHLRHLGLKHPEAARQRHAMLRFVIIPSRLSPFVNRSFFLKNPKSLFHGFRITCRTAHRERSRRAPAEGVLDAIHSLCHALTRSNPFSEGTKLVLDQIAKFKVILIFRVKREKFIGGFLANEKSSSAYAFRTKSSSRFLPFSNRLRSSSRFSSACFRASSRFNSADLKMSAKELDELGSGAELIQVRGRVNPQIVPNRS